jgi:hypothetical protein
MKNKIILIVLIGIVLLAGAVFAQFGSGSSYVNKQSTYDSKAIYGADYNVYWPTVRDLDQCFAREDILLQLSPAGCQPTVVRSDLLAEQNVPVFCQIDGLKINPLIDVKQVNNIRFIGEYPPEVIGAGYHPARSALRSRDTELLGDPLINNLGYVVTVLKRNPIENELPDKVEFVLNAQIEYDAGNAFGIGKAEFLLEQYGSEEQWLRNRNKNSFWDGRYFVRLEEVQPEYAVVSIYQGDSKVSTSRINREVPSNDLFVPGLYCQANLEAEYDGLVGASNTALIKVNNDLLEVSEGSTFLNEKCIVDRLDVGSVKSEGEVSIVCGDTGIELKLESKEVTYGDEVVLKGDSNGVIWNIEEIISKIRFIITNGFESREVGSDDVRFISESKLLEATYDSETEQYFADSIASFEQIVDDYPAEKIDAIREDTYGERALLEAIDLADEFGKQLTEARLISKFLRTYPNSFAVDRLNNELDSLYVSDTSEARENIFIDNTAFDLRLVAMYVEGASYAEFSWGSDSFEIVVSESEFRVGRGEVRLSRMDSSSVNVDVVCDNEPDERESFRLGFGEQKAICGSLLVLKDINQRQFAKVRLNPKAGKIITETNFTVSIGIEKRAIELNPEKAEEKIENLQETIDKWSSISEGLTDLSKSLKSACFATAGVLTVKNFLSGLGGEGFARQKVMNEYWNDECARLVDGGSYATQDQCYLKEAKNINSDVDAVKNAMNKVNDKVKNVQSGFSKPVKGVGSLFGESVINTEDSTNAFVDGHLLAEEKYRNYVIDLGDGNTVTVDKLLNDADYGSGDFSYDQARELMLNVDLALPGSGVSDGVRNAANSNLGNIGNVIIGNKELSKRLSESRIDLSKGLPAMGSLLGDGQEQVVRVAHVGTKEAVQEQLNIGLGGASTHVAQFPAPALGGFASGVYVMGLSRPSQSSNTFLVNQVFKRDDNGEYVALTGENINKFQEVYGIGAVEAAEGVSYSNKYLNPEIKFFETEPFKGMPAVVPFDMANGWYAATEQNLPVFGSISSFDASGAPRSFWVCNVGKDGREQFLENRARDICQLINLNTGQPLNQFPGLDEVSARNIVNKAMLSLREAATQYQEGRKGVMSIVGNSVPVGLPAANIPGTQCQEFMSPGDCHLLFNVCDPVICPSSRCDFGGEYPVADVIQSGIFGSLLLCAPNIREGIFLPVCLTGVQAGVDGYLSVLQSHQQCLQENIETGQTVGICDEISSIYTCEFFWRQASPLADVIVPKAFEVATGQTAARGGGEYLNVQNAWQQAQGSVEFFTNSYAVNSIEAFKLRSTEEAGSQFCKAFVSAKGPKSLEALIEPDSPPQFHAWFSSTRFTDATLPATAQYKVFFHIFAGKDTGVPYSVYLRDPPTSSFYNINPTVPVASGFVTRGEFVSDTVDFTAPEGYKELCVRIQDREECGFKQVSTSFAVNYLRDEFVGDELTRTDIVSQTDCVSGSGLSAMSLLNANPQAIFEEAVNPDVYNRGVIRICSSQNPGIGTDMERFVNVGYCDEPSVRCWLDKTSVDASLSRNLDLDEGIKERTLFDLENVELENLKKAGEILELDSINSIIVDVEDEIDYGLSMERAHELLAVVDGTLAKTVLNYQKAHLVLLKGEIYAIVARNIMKEIIRVEDPGEEIVVVSDELDEVIIIETEDDLEIIETNAPSQDCSVVKVKSTREEVGAGETFSVRVDFVGSCGKWGELKIVLDKAGGGEISLPDYALTQEDKTKKFYIFSYSIDEGGIYLFIAKTKYSENGIIEESSVDYDISDPAINSQIVVS